MKRLTTSILLLALAASAATAQYKGSPYIPSGESETVSALEGHVQFLSSPAREGRLAGSEGEKEAAIYVASVLKEYGVELFSPEEGDLFGIHRESGDTLTSRNVTGFIPGHDKALRDHYIVIAARLDNMGTNELRIGDSVLKRVYPGANGNASGLAMLLELARKLSINSVLLGRSVIIAAFGSSLQSGAGAWYFLNRSFGGTPQIDAMINLDMVGTISGGFYAYTSSNADMNRILEAVSAELQPVRPRIVTDEPCESDHRAFYDSHIPSVFFTTGMYPEYNTWRDTPDIIEYPGMEKELEYIYNFTMTLSGTDKPRFAPPTEEEKVQAASAGKVFAYYECDRRPAFLGHTDPSWFLQEWVYRYLRYPREAVEKGIQGRVPVAFIIDEKGQVTDVRVIRPVDPLLDEEAVRVVSSSISWKPGTVKGKPVKAEMSVYVDFILEKNK